MGIIVHESKQKSQKVTTLCQIAENAHDVCIRLNVIYEKCELNVVVLSILGEGVFQMV